MQDDQCAYIDLFLEHKDEDGVPYIADANVFTSHAWRYDALDSIECMIEAEASIKANRKSEEPLCVPVRHMHVLLASIWLRACLFYERVGTRNTVFNMCSAA